MKKFFRICALVSLLIPAALSAKKTETVINVIPYPQSVEIGSGTFKGTGAIFNCDLEIDSKSMSLILARLAELLAGAEIEDPAAFASEVAELF